MTANQEPPTATAGFDAADIDDAAEDIFGAQFDEQEPDEPSPPPVARPKAKPTVKAAPKPPAVEDSDEEETAEDEPEEPEEETPPASEEEAEEDEEDASVLKQARDAAKVQAILDARREKLQKARQERDEAKAELERLRAEQAPAEPLVLTPTLNSPLANVQSAADLAKAEAAWQKELEWCLDNPQGGVRENGEEEREWSAAEVKARAKQATAILKDAIPQQRQWLKAMEADVRTAAETMPFFNPKDPMHPELVAFGDRLMKERPELFYAPDRASLAGKLFAFEKIAAGTHRMVKVGGQLKLLPVTRDSDGTGLPAKKPAGARPGAASLKAAAPPPARRNTEAARRADLRKSDDPEEAFSADMDDWLDSVGIV